MAALLMLAPPAAATSTGDGSRSADAAQTYVLVKGRLVDTEGAPVTGFAVQLDGTSAPHDATRGEFAWYVPADEPVRLEVVGPDIDKPFSSTFFTLRPDPISLSQDTDLGDLVMPPFRRSVTIRVHDENNRPVRYLNLHQHPTRLTDTWLGSGWQYSPLIKQSATGWDTLSTWNASQNTDKRGETTFHEYPALRDGELLPGMTAETYDSNNRTYVADFENAVRTGPDSFDVLMPGLRQPVTSPDAPPAPTAVGQDRSALVTWEAPFDGHSPITGYTITTDPGGATKTVTDADATSAVVTGLTNGSSYRFTVRATNAQGTGLPSEASNSVLPGARPSPPPAPEVKGDDRSVLVTVRNPKAPTLGPEKPESYTITAYPGGQKQTVGGGSGATAIFKGLSNGTAYRFRATATNTYGSSAQSLPSTSVIPAGRPERVAKPTVRVTNRQMKVSWVEPDMNGGVVKSYEVEAVGPNFSERRTRKPTKGALSTTFRAPRPGTYYFRVRARNTYGASGAPGNKTTARVR